MIEYMKIETMDVFFSFFFNNFLELKYMDFIVGTWQTCTIIIDWVMVHKILDQDKILFKNECTIKKR